MLRTNVKSRRADGLILVLGVLAVSVPVEARKSDQVDELIRRGVELRRSGQDAKALEAFRSAFQIHAVPRAQAQMGFAEQALGQWVDAEKDLTAALQAKDDAWIAKNAMTIRASVATVGQHLGSLQMLGSPAGAHIKVDERDVGTLPLDAPVRVTAGEILITVSAPGYIEISRKLSVRAGGLARDVITLHAVAPPREPVAQAERSMQKEDKSAAPISENNVANADVPPVRPSPGGGGESPAHAAPGHGLSTTQSWAIGVGALGVATAGVGTVFAAQALSRNRDSRSGCQGDLCDPAGSELRRQALAAGNKATVSFAVAGVLVAGGVVLFVVGRSSAAAPRTLAISPVASPDSFALVGTTRF